MNVPTLLIKTADNNVNGQNCYKNGGFYQALYF